MAHTHSSRMLFRVAVALGRKAACNALNPRTSSAVMASLVSADCLRSSWECNNVIVVDVHIGINIFVFLTVIVRVIVRCNPGSDPSSVRHRPPIFGNFVPRQHRLRPKRSFRLARPPLLWLQHLETITMSLRLLKARTPAKRWAFPSWALPKSRLCIAI